LTSCSESQVTPGLRFPCALDPLADHMVLVTVPAPGCDRQPPGPHVDDPPCGRARRMREAFGRGSDARPITARGVTLAVPLITATSASDNPHSDNSKKRHSQLNQWCLLYEIGPGRIELFRAGSL